MKEETFDNKPSGVPIADPHYFFRWVGDKPERKTVRDLALRLANYYLQTSRTRNQWSKIKAREVCQWEGEHNDGSGNVGWRTYNSVPLRLDDFERELETGQFDCTKMGLPATGTHWLDSAIIMSPNFHAPSNTRQRALTFQAESVIGARFPLTPRIDREGTILNSFQGLLLKRIASLRAELVTKSNNPAAEEWFQAFRTMVAECVSLIDNTLHQLYFKAKYDPLPGWQFDEAGLGSRHGGRVLDKLKWVFQITRRELHARDEVRDFAFIKELRNHLQHFDPPAFAFTLEDMAHWLNCVKSVAELNLKIRECAGAPPDAALVELLLQRRVEFCPRDPGKRRVAQPANVGYASTSEAAMAQPAPAQHDGDIVLHSFAGRHRLLGPREKSY